ncbi:MAG: ATP-dependent helicase [Desulfovibrionaceae bacterium]
MGIDFEHSLNPAQLQAVRHGEGPLLVIAGAGSGKTRTIVYRLAHLVEHGVPPEAILLLTFTRKAAQEMLLRAETILGRPLSGASGGTFHAFAYGVLRRFGSRIGLPAGFTLLDRADSEALLRDIRTDLELGKGDKSFPKRATLCDIITKSRNKERDVHELVEDEFHHLTPHLADMERIAEEYDRRKREHGVADYDDLLFRLEELLVANPDVLEELRARHRYLMVDEYQDTNRVQARLVRLLAGPGGNVMAVGDDAQSIYAFRGANVQNILDFPTIFAGARLVRLEQNYRSLQPVLTLTNCLLAGAATKFDKRLYSDRTEGPLPRVVRPLSDQSQAGLVVSTVIDLARRMPLSDIAVLFRAGYQSYSIEVALGRVGIDYQKYGGLRFSEAAHIKDVLAYLRLVVNPTDRLAWQRVLEPIKGVGAKTSGRIVRAVLGRDTEALEKFKQKFKSLSNILEELDKLRAREQRPAQALQQVLSFYAPILTERFPDDYPKRQAGLDQLAQIALNYDSLPAFLADLVLDPEEDAEARKVHALVLSTVHSAKGLEWRAVLIIDLVEDRFPSRRALARAEDLEEERRLLYVACTRAKEELFLFAPASITNRATGLSEPAMPSPFLRELSPDCYQAFNESYSGGLQLRETGNGTAYGRAGAPGPLSAGLSGPWSGAGAGGAGAGTEAGAGLGAGPHPEPAPDATPDAAPATAGGALAGLGSGGERPNGAGGARLGLCRHKIFGQGKIIAHIPPNKYRVNFPGFGLKVIVADYLELI